MSLQDSVSAACVQVDSMKKDKKNQRTARKVQATGNKDSPQADNVIKLAERAAARSRSPKRRTTMAKNSNAQQQAVEAPQTVITLEALQMLIQAAQANGGASTRKQRGRLNNRKVRDVIVVSFQVDRSLAEDLDMLFTEMLSRGDVTSKRETYEKAWFEGVKAIRQQNKAVR